MVTGSQASPVYTLMLRCSQSVPPSIRTTCYSFLGTLEILGKQLSLFLAGVLAELFGYLTGLSISLAVSLLVVVMVWYCPAQLRNTEIYSDSLWFEKKTAVNQQSNWAILNWALLHQNQSNHFNQSKHTWTKQRTNQNSKQIKVNGVKRGKTPASGSPMILVY